MKRYLPGLIGAFALVAGAVPVIYAGHGHDQFEARPTEVAAELAFRVVYGWNNAGQCEEHFQRCVEWTDDGCNPPGWQDELDGVSLADPSECEAREEIVYSWDYGLGVCWRYQATRWHVRTRHQSYTFDLISHETPLEGWSWFACLLAEAWPEDRPHPRAPSPVWAVDMGGGSGR